MASRRAMQMARRSMSWLGNFLIFQ